MTDAEVCLAICGFKATVLDDGLRITRKAFHLKRFGVFSEDIPGCGCVLQDNGIPHTVEAELLEILDPEVFERQRETRIDYPADCIFAHPEDAAKFA